MVTAKLYIEGGGNRGQYRSKDLQIRFRQAWHLFFKAAGIPRLPSVVRGGGRGQTFKRFRVAIANPARDAVPLLLLDSEGPVASGQTVWQYLLAANGWHRPGNAREDQAFLMVQSMETWFLADQLAMQRYFGQNFSTAAFRAWTQLEAVPKPTVLKALETATSRCQKPYGKGRVSFELLGRINPFRVESACLHGAALLDRLRSI